MVCIPGTIGPSLPSVSRYQYTGICVDMYATHFSKLQIHACSSKLKTRIPVSLILLIDVVPLVLCSINSECVLAELLNTEASVIFNYLIFLFYFF